MSILGAKLYGIPKWLFAPISWTSQDLGANKKAWIPNFLFAPRSWTSQDLGAKEKLGLQTFFAPGSWTSQDLGAKEKFGFQTCFCSQILGLHGECIYIYILIYSIYVHMYY